MNYRIDLINQDGEIKVAMEIEDKTVGNSIVIVLPIDDYKKMVLGMLNAIPQIDELVKEYNSKRDK